jgi:hypothetical protein
LANSFLDILEVFVLALKHLLPQGFFTGFSGKCKFASQCSYYYQQSYTCQHPSKYCGNFRKRINPHGDKLSKQCRLADKIFLLSLALSSLAIYLSTWNPLFTAAACAGLAGGLLLIAAPLIVKVLGNRYGGR